jgi:hypothetical protein
MAWLPAVTRIPFARQAHDFRLQRGAHLLERHGNQRLNQRHAAVDIRGRVAWCRHETEVLSSSSNLSYVPRHG